MSSSIKKGKRTHNKIIYVAKHHFYNHGYHAVRIKDIVSECNISPGNLTYYFPTKAMIAVEIFSQYIDSIFDFIDANMPNLQHFYYKNLYMSVIFNIAIFNKSEYKRYYKEVMSEKSHHFLLRTRINDVYIKLLESFDITMTDDDYKYFTYADLGARHEILSGYMNGELPELTPVTLTKVLHNNTIKLMGVEQKVFDTMFEQIETTIYQFDFSEIKLL